MPQALIDRLKLWGEILGALGVIGAAFTGVIVVFGGHVPPWFSFADAQVLQQQDVQQSVSVELLQHQYYSDKLDTAQDELKKDPSSKAALAEVRRWQWQLKTVDVQLTKAGAPPP